MPRGCRVLRVTQQHRLPNSQRRWRIVAGVYARTLPSNDAMLASGHRGRDVFCAAAKDRLGAALDPAMQIEYRSLPPCLMVHRASGAGICRSMRRPYPSAGPQHMKVQLARLLLFPCWSSLTVATRTRR
eukprot:scaffold245521_cov28-Tisochrysis_lutea.AAC.3